MNRRLIAVMLFSLSASAMAQKADFFVALNGNDSWSGKLAAPGASGDDGPLASLRAARDATRKTGMDRTRRIVVRGGEYFLEEPLALDERDSNLTVEAAAGENAILYGGRQVTGWKRDGDRFWAATLPAVAAKSWDFRALVVNGRFCRRARLPKTGAFTHLSEFRVPWMSTTGGGWKRKPTPEELTTLKYRPDDLGAWLDTRNAELTVYHMWDESLVGIASLDDSSHTLRFSNPAGHPPGAFGVKKYVVWNVREGMTEPGQWYLDRAAGRVVYWPLPGEDMAAAKVIAPTSETAIQIAGVRNAHAKNITLKGLTLSVTNTPLVAGGYGARKFDGAVSVRLADDCRLLDLTIVNVGGQGIKATACANLRVENCDVHETGACGILVQGTDSAILNNHVRRNGLTYPSAIGLWFGGKGGRISHNEVHDTPYSAIVGGGEKHLVEANLIYDAMKELHDGGGIYIGFCKEIVLRGNLIRDIADTGGYGASAYYLDEQAQDCVVEDNVSIGVATPSHNHMATKNVIRHNVFLYDGNMKLTFPRSSDYRLEGNVICAKGNILITNPDAIVELPKNVIYSETGKVEVESLKDYSAAGRTPLAPRDGTQIANPLLVSDGRAYRFADKSPALNLGIKPVDVSTAGREAATGK